MASGAVSLVDQIPQRVKVPLGLRHLLVIHEKMLAVNPESRKRLAGDSFTLSNLVLVMGENIVDAAAMNIERVAEILHRHCGAFQMPAWTADAERRSPSRLLLVFRGFPQHEIVGLLLLVFIRIDSCADFQFAADRDETVFRSRENSKCGSKSNPLPDRHGRISATAPPVESSPECSLSPE